MEKVDIINIPAGVADIEPGNGFTWTGFGGINVRGLYIDGETYYRNDIVNHNESLYWCLQENDNEPFTATDYWSLIGSSSFNYIDGSLVFAATAATDLSENDIVDFTSDASMVHTTTSISASVGFTPTGIVFNANFASGETALILVRGELPIANVTINGTLALGSDVYFDIANNSLTVLANDYRVGVITTLGDTQSQVSFDLGGVDSTFSNEASDNLIVQNSTNVGRSTQTVATNFDNLNVVTTDIQIQNLIPSITLPNDAVIAISCDIEWDFDNTTDQLLTGRFQLDYGDGVRALDSFIAATPSQTHPTPVSYTHLTLPTILLV